MFLCKVVKGAGYFFKKQASKSCFFLHFYMQIAIYCLIITIISGVIALFAFLYQCC